MNRLRDRVDDPATLVDRLRGVYKNGSGEYPDASPPYKTAPIMQEAAREIERLRGQLESLLKEFWKYKGYDLKWRDDTKPASEGDMKVYNELAANYFKDVKGE